MAVDYLCKMCKGHLKVKTSIILAASKLNSSQRGLVLLDPELGNYTTTTHPPFSIEEGAEYIYTCPICHSQLNSAKYNHLVRIIRVEEDGKQYDVYFSDIGGEKCTFKLGDDKLEVQGPDASLYNKYFDIPEEDKKYL
ncbi:MAG: hypothetical protein JXR66_11335 [Bacteroidales bacterium]|nr:hypothetical protein [Bacteroidales bacterium]MBN2634144.1 hypothetical protein [Bacteroidales bacterium]